MDCYRKLASQSSVYAQVYCCVWSGIREQQLPLQLFWERNLLGFIQSMIPLQGDSPKIPVCVTHSIKCHSCYPISLGFVWNQ